MRTFEVLYEKGVSSDGEFFEEIIEKCYRHILRVGAEAVDAGANWGRHTIPMADSVGKNGRVFAIEPLPQLAERLGEICPANVTVINAAIGNVSREKVDFHYVKDRDGLSALVSPVKNPWMAPEVAKSIEIITVSQRTLDDLVPSACNIRLVKMDLEGGEFHALQGAKDVILRDRPFLIFEHGDEYSASLYNFTPEQFFNLFLEHGYITFDLFGREFRREHWHDQGYPWYLMAVSKSSLDEDYIRTTHPQILQSL
jgi:FkbM family methyltransferase